MAGRHSDLENLHTSYNAFVDQDNDDESDDESPPLFYGSGQPASSNWHQTQQNMPKHKNNPKSNNYSPDPESHIIHTVPEENRSRWSHIEDLDTFFKNIYTYHQKHGFRVMLVQRFSELLQVVFILFLSVYLLDCVDYQTLFNNKPESKGLNHKVTLSEVLHPPGQCMTKLSFSTLIFLLSGLSFWMVKLMGIFYQFFQFWDIKHFFNQALHIDDGDLDSHTWRDVQKRLVDAQKDHMMCIHKQHLTDLDIYHRILRFKNYMVAMINKDILPVRVSIVPCLPSFVFMSQGLKFNLEWLFFKGPWAAFDKWRLKDDFKKLSKKNEIVNSLQNRILILALLNLLMMPLIFLWQILYCFFNYAELIKREPGSLGVRKWSRYGKLYLRHLNELDHELKARLNRAYEPANQYMEIFVSPMSVVIARFFTFLASSVLAIILALAVWDEDVLNVEHILTIITSLGGIIAVCKVFIPDENMVFCPEKTLTAVIAHIHYFPVENWRGRAHTFEVMSHLNELFPYTALCLVEELLSPIITPLVLLFMVHPKAGKIVDFFRNFTVDVTGVGDICSFAQMDVRRHGNPAWQQQGDNNDLEPDQPSGSPKSNKSNVDAYSQAEAGKTEMSLINFTLANPDWKPPNESKEFINALRGHATKDIKTLSVLDEEKFESNPLYSSLTALENVGGIYTEIAQNLLMSTNLVSNQAPPQINLFGAAHSHSAAATAPAMPNNNPFHSEINSQQHSLAGGSMVQSIRQGIANVTSIMPHGAPVPNLRKDLRRLGLEYTVADMSLSALYLHELHQRSTSSQNSPINHGNSKNGGNGNVQNYGLNDVSEEECVPLVEQA